MNPGQSTKGGCNYADSMRSSAAKKSDGEDGEQVQANYGDEKNRLNAS